MHKVFNKRLDEKYYFERIGDLPVFIIPKKGVNAKVAALAVNYGSVDNAWQGPDGLEISVPEGIAHFLEHQQFKKADGDTSMEFARFGAMYNAGTGNNSTTYYFQCSEYFRENLDILLKVALTSYFNPENVAKEKSIIEQELRMYNDMPGFKVYDNLMSNLYKVHPVRISIGGTVESVRTITPELLEQCYQTFYRPSNMVLVLCGDFEAEIAGLIRSINDSPYLKGRAELPDIVRRMPDEPPVINNYSKEESMATSSSNLLIGYKETRNGLTGLPLLERNIISDMLLDLIFGKSGRLYSRLYEDKLIDDRFGCGYSAHQTYGFTVISGETDRPDELYRRLMSELAKLARTKICGRRELEQQKRKMIGKFTWVFNSPMAIASVFAGYYFTGIFNMPRPGQEIYEMARLIKKVTVGDLQKRFQEHLDPKYHSISIVRPLGPVDKSPDGLTL
jgi:predicted Zn-dependent peptidase